MKENTKKSDESRIKTSEKKKRKRKKKSLEKWLNIKKVI